MIDLPEGLYEVDQAYLVDASRNRLSLRNVTFEIWLDKKGQKQLRGRGLINNFNFTRMLEDSEDVDLVLRFFDDYFLWLKEPVIQAGKVFEPATESSCIFTVGEKISPVSQEQYLELTGLQELGTELIVDLRLQIFGNLYQALYSMVHAVSHITHHTSLAFNLEHLLSLILKYL